jgi:hypothetical protein
VQYSPRQGLSRPVRKAELSVAIASPVRGFLFLTRCQAGGELPAALIDGVGGVQQVNLHAFRLLALRQAVGDVSRLYDCNEGVLQFVFL